MLTCRAAPLADSHGIADTGEFTAIIATEARALDGGELDIGGADLSAFEQNPVLLADHDRREPIGRAVSIERLADKIVARFRLASLGISEAADRLRALIAENIVNAVSIGFQPLQVEPLADGGQRITRWRLHEVSTVAVPADPGALIVSRAAPAAAPKESNMEPVTIESLVDQMLAAFQTRAAAAPIPPTVPLQTRAKTLGQLVTAGDFLQRASKGTVREEFALSLRALGTPVIQAPGVPVVTPTAYLGVDSGYVGIPRLGDVITQVPIDSGHYAHGIITPTGNAAAKTPEGAAKPAQSFATTTQTGDVPTIPVWTKVTTQLLADAPGFLALLDGILSGLCLDALDAEIYARLTAAGAHTPWAGAVSGDNFYDGIIRMTGDLAGAGAKQIVIGVNPADWTGFLTLKAATSGVYLLPPSVPAQIVPTPTVAAGSLLGFDQSAVALLVRESVAVQVGLDADDWTKNLRTVLAELRAEAISRRPALVMFGPAVAAAVAATARAK